MFHFVVNKLKHNEFKTTAISEAKIKSTKSQPTFRIGLFNMQGTEVVENTEFISLCPLCSLWLLNIFLTTENTENTEFISL
jgi:hypothetical protein